tara:strand:+ start:162 stop:560 length:399 start_codon:yes stop_codon:yes gene_type:complete
MAEDFGFSEELHKNPLARVETLKAELEEANTDDVEDIMIIIMDTFKEEALYPEPGNFYTFVYQPKTPDIEYDQHPLIACVGLFNWGFRGLNFHWQRYRNYTWAEVVGKLHVVKYQELDELLSLQYGKFLLNK